MNLSCATNRGTTCNKVQEDVESHNDVGIRHNQEKIISISLVPIKIKNSACSTGVQISGLQLGCTHAQSHSSACFYKFTEED